MITKMADNFVGCSFIQKSLLRKKNAELSPFNENTFKVVCQH